MSLPLLATAEDLATKLGIVVDTARAELVLSQASSVIRGLTRQTLTAVAGDSVRLTVVNGVLTLPQIPVTAVTSVSALAVDGTPTALTTAQYWFDGFDEVVIIDATLWVSCPVGIPRQATVVYSHGYATVPEALRDATVTVAAGGYAVSPGGYKSETIGDYSYTVGDVSAGSLSEGQLDSVLAYAKVRIPL